MRASLVPPPPIRRLRDLTRARTDLNRDRVRQIHRLEKILQDAGIKLSSVATDIMGQSSRAMLEALIEGKTDPAALADLAKRRLRSKIPALTEALTGRFTPHHGYLIRMHLDLIDSYTTALSDLDTKIIDALSPSLVAARDLLCSIPGWSTTVAEVFLAETGGDMTAFPTAGHLASWAGVCPGANESAGRVKSTRPAPATATSKALSASPPSRRHDPGTPTSPPSTAASARIGDRRKPSSSWNGRWSWPRTAC